MADVHTRRPAAIAFLSALLLTVVAKSSGAADDDSFFTHLHTEKAMANVTVMPGRSGPVEIAIQLETVDERPLVAKAVAVTLTDVQSGKKLDTAQAERTGEDHWRLKIPALTAGRWMLGLGISMTDTDKISIEAPIVIAATNAKVEKVPGHHH